MTWHLFSLATDVLDADAPECRIDLVLFNQLVDRDMWDRTLADAVPLVYRLLDAPDPNQRYGEFEEFDIFDNSILLAVRYVRSIDAWELFETFRDDEESFVDGGDAEDEEPE